MPDTRIKVALEPAELKHLRAVAKRESRSVTAQASFYVTRGLEVDKYDRARK